MPARGSSELEAAAYPPVCGGRSGEVSLSLGRSGAMIVHVHPGECRAEEFRLKLLFETGTCVFSTPHELWSFWTGPLAAAFGIAPAASDEPPLETPSVEADATPSAAAGAPPAESLLADLAPGKEQPPEEGTTAGRASVALRVDETGPSPRPERRLTAASLAAELAPRDPRPGAGARAGRERGRRTADQAASARPGSVLLIGPTGVGKTTTVEALPGRPESARLRGRARLQARLRRADRLDPAHPAARLAARLQRPHRHDAAASPRSSGRAASCSSTSWRRPTRTCSTCSSACSTPAACATPPATPSMPATSSSP